MNVSDGNGGPILSARFGKREWVAILGVAVASGTLLIGAMKFIGASPADVQIREHRLATIEHSLDTNTQALEANTKALADMSRLFLDHLEEARVAYQRLAIIEQVAKDHERRLNGVEDDP